MQIDQIRRRGVIRAGAIVILAGLVGACAEQSGPAPVFQKGSAEPIVGPTPAPPPALQVIVKRGQTLDGFAYTYHVKKAAIVAANGLRPPYELKAGMRLTIPSTGSAPVRHAAAPPASVAAAPLSPPRAAPPMPEQAAIPQPPSTPQTIAVPQPSLPPQTIFPAPQQAAAPPPPAPPHAPTATQPSLTPPPSAAKVLPETIPLDGPPPAKQAAPQQQAGSTPPVVAQRNPAAALPLPGEAAPPPASAESAQANATGRFPWPVRGRVLANYGNTPGGGHNDGINIAAPRGTPVRAIDGGTVAYVGNEVKGYGNLVLIRHDKGWISAYAHLDGLNVKQGETISSGAVIAKVGDSGGVAEPQLHFELRRGKKPVNPKEFLAPSPSAGAPLPGKAG